MDTGKTNNDAPTTSTIILLLGAGAFNIVIAIGGLLVLYGIVLLIFRYAFGVELFNPFG
jgi:hypothetical protein